MHNISHKDYSIKQTKKETLPKSLLHKEEYSYNPLLKYTKIRNPKLLRKKKPELVYA